MTDADLSSITAARLLDALASACMVVNADGQIVYVNAAFETLIKRPASQLIGEAATHYLKPGGLLASSVNSADLTCPLCTDTPSEKDSHSNSKTDMSKTAANASFPKTHTALLSQALERENELPSAADSPCQGLLVKVTHSVLPVADDQNATPMLVYQVEPFSEEATLIQAHGDFLSTVSHEFRTPLTSIKGFADTLLQYGAQLPDEEKRRFVSIIKDQADRLIRLVENLLTVSKMGAESVDLSYRSLDVKRLLERISQSLQAKWQTKHKQPVPFDIRVQPASLQVWADSDRLEQILINLMDNAIKYSSNGSTVFIQAGLSPENESDVFIRVCDQGVGIPKELLPRIFTKFYRVETPLKQDVEGTGLGLYIAQSLTQAMGGRLSVESEPGKGSAFTLTLPAATLERQALHQKRQGLNG